jgi:hypothetical protein
MPKYIKLDKKIKDPKTKKLRCVYNKIIDGKIDKSNIYIKKISNGKSHYYNFNLKQSGGDDMKIPDKARYLLGINSSADKRKTLMELSREQKKGGELPKITLTKLEIPKNVNNNIVAYNLEYNRNRKSKIYLPKIENMLATDFNFSNKKVLK